MKKRITLIFLAFFVLVILLVISLTPSIINQAKPSDWRRPPLVRLWHAGQIADGLYAYKNDHGGHLPEQLRELFPKYINLTNIACVFPYRFDFQKNGMLTTTNFIEMIEKNGAYNYLGERGIQLDMILYERSNLWPLDTKKFDASNDVKNLVITIDTNFTTKALPVAEIKKKLEMNSTRQP